MCKKAVANRIPCLTPSRNQWKHSRQSSSQLPALYNPTCALSEKHLLLVAKAYCINIQYDFEKIK